MGATPTPERFSLLLGLAVVMLVTLPRYLLGGHQSRLTLLGVALVVVIGVALAHWRLLADEARRRLPALLRRLAVCLVAGVALTAGWQLLAAGWQGWAILVSHGATLGLLLHALGLWWKPLESSE
ncbi:hypothetical protein [Halomonas beimenensis]|uniref:Transmembrane protein n=2 Tax=Halomonas beimenensis TaxID=475662 RepID=A0A291P7S2_9GAMM|nr:hypothetical protein [Halomonas beimenensis]ATJ82901.1 hypothetical protein BEI_1914 [Halomonas beimenensis]